MIGEGPAAFYRDACQILDAEAGLPPQVVRGPSEISDDVPSPPQRLVAAAHLVGHLFREIESAIRDVLLPAGARTGQRQQHRSEIDAILTAYELDQDATLVEAWYRLTGESNLARQAHRDDLARPRALDDTARRAFSDAEAVFDVVLGRFEERFHEMLGFVEELVAKHPPTKADLDSLRKRVPNNLITRHYFFSNATDPAWLNLLADDRAFESPPEPMLDEGNDSPVMQPWPETQYLARMAAVPELQVRVAEIALAVPPTQNFRVHEDLADVVLALPVPLALQFVDRASTWCRDPWFSRVADKIGTLIEHFLDAGEIDAALLLAGVLFDPECRPDPLSGHEASEYEQCLQRLAPSLVRVGGLRALEVLTSCLVKLLRGAGASDQGDREDFSDLWRPAIEPGGNSRQALIDAVRDGAEAVCNADPSQLGPVVRFLESVESPVLDRIALHLLRVAPDVPVDLVAPHLLDRDRLDNSNLWHEYTLLAQSRLGDLALDDQAQIVRWEVERRVELATEIGSGEVEEPETRDRRARASEHWALERFRGVLPDEFRARHEELEREFGRAEHPEFLSYHGGVQVGWPSPKTAEELRAFSVEGLIAYLKEWTPGNGFMSPSREGLAQELGNLVAAEPERFAATSRSFRELHPSYVQGLLGGLNGAVRKKREFDWEPVLGLCAWAMEQTTPAGSGKQLADGPDLWARVRSEVARLLDHGFLASAHELPFELRDQAWAIVEELANDPDPTPEQEAVSVRSDSSAYNLAINTIRGTAVGAAVQYGLWVRRHLGERSSNFDSLPELRSLLATHLNPSVDPSLAVRSVYGRCLPGIHLLDPGWTAAHLGQILPIEGALEHYRQAAWSAYILYCRPYDEVFPVLRDEYSYAINKLGEPLDQTPRSPSERLAEHLMVLYLRGQIDLNDDLLAGFFLQATEATRQHAMRFVGRVLRGNDDLEVALKARATALWESRTADRDVATIFGWWFAASSLDAGWRIVQLERVLSINPVVEPDHGVFDQFQVLVLQYPLLVLACVRRMIEGAANRWKIFSWRRELRGVLEAALRSENPEVTREAGAIIGLLVARGETDYRTLLGPSI